MILQVLIQHRSFVHEKKINMREEVALTVLRKCREKEEVAKSKKKHNNFFYTEQENDICDCIGCNEIDRISYNILSNAKHLCVYVKYKYV